MDVDSATAALAELRARGFSMMRRSLLLPLLPLALLAGSCHDQQASLTENGNPDAGTGGGNDQGIVHPEDGWVVLIVDPESVDGQVLGQQQLTAHLFNSHAQRLPNIPLSFEIVGNNPGGATLSALSVSTDDQGKAVDELSLGSTQAEYDVSVSIPSAPTIDPALIHVVVHDRPTGTLEVSFEGVGPNVNIGPIKVFAMPGTTSCPYNPVVNPAGELAHATVATADQKTTFPDDANGDDHHFVAGQSLTLWAWGMVGNQTMSTRAAGGCLENVVVPANGVGKAKVTMVVHPLNTVGTFDVVGKYDFTGAIPGTAGQVIEDLSDFFNGQVAQVLIDGVKALIREFFSGIVADVVSWVLDQVGPFVDDYINQWFADIAPPWLRDFMQVGQDLMQIVNNLEILSIIRFDKTGSDFTVAGTEEWTGIALYWHLGCPDDAPPDCGRYEFDMAELEQGDQPIEAVYATFNARTENFNHLKMDPHDVNLQYGRLILFVLNNLILPQVADGAHSITEAIINMIDCDGLAYDICGDDGVWEESYLGIHVGFSADDVIGWCQSAAGLVGNLANNILEGLSFDSVMTIEGDCDLYEDNFDLLVDRLEDGHYKGTFHIDGVEESNHFSGTYRGDRRVESH